MLDLNKIVSEVDLKCKMNGVEIIQIATENNDVNRSKILLQEVNQAVDFAFNRRKGTNLNYSKDLFLNEADRWFYTIVNMTYTAIEKIGIEGHTALNVGGTNRSFESGGKYLLSDVLSIIPLGG